MAEEKCGMEDEISREEEIEPEAVWESVYETTE